MTGPLRTAVWSALLFTVYLVNCPSLTTAHSDAKVCRQKDKQCYVMHEWVKMEYLWPNETMKTQYIQDGRYDPTHCLLSGVKVYRGEIFVTIPRIRYYTGVPSVLNKVVIDVDGLPKLEPFPNWEIQQQGDDCDNLQMGMSIEIDPLTGLLYIIDPGRPGIVGDPAKGEKEPNKCPPKLVVFDINAKTKVRSHELPSNVSSKDTNFLNDIVLDRGSPTSKEVRWVYITDALDSKLYIMDLLTNQTRAVYDPSMDYEDDESTITVNGAKYTLKLPIDGLAMTPDFEYVYYCALGSRKLWRVPTFALRDAKYNISDYVDFVGNKISQTGGMIYAENSLYYGGLSKNAVYRWDVKQDKEEQKVEEEEVRIATEIQLAKDNLKLVWPDAFAIDESGYMYFSACRANLFLKGAMDFDGDAGSNFRIWKINIGELGYLSPHTSYTSGVQGTGYGFIAYVTLLLSVPLSRLIYYLGNNNNS